MSVVRLKSFDCAELDVYARLTDNQLRNRLDPARAVMIAESHLVVEVALEAGIEPLSFLADEAHAHVALELLERFGLAEKDVPVFVLPDAELEKLTGYRLVRGLLCAMRRPAPRAASEVIGASRHLAVIENLVDVSNVGALFRSAAALGADGVVLSPTCADPLSRRALRVSMGCALKVPWARATADEWPCAAFDQMHAAGMEICAMALVDGAVPLDDPSLDPACPRALVFGNEGAGLEAATLAACDRAVIIPMAAGVDSLNVAASSAVAFWQLFK